MITNKNRCCEKPPEEENSCLYVPTTTCLLCGKEVALAPDELITHLREIGEGTYICPLCRLMGDAEKDDTAADDKSPEDDNTSKFVESLEKVAAGIIDLLVLGSWMMKAAKYGLPEDLVVEIYVRIAQHVINEVMEDERDGSYETESDSDEAAEACAGCGGANPPEGPGSGTAERGDSGFSVQAELRMQTDLHVTIQSQDTTT